MRARIDNNCVSHTNLTEAKIPKIYEESLMQVLEACVEILNNCAYGKARSLTGYHEVNPHILWF